jgi:hypothetical protein
VAAASDRATPGAETRSLFVESPARNLIVRSAPARQWANLDEVAADLAEFEHHCEIPSLGRQSQRIVANNEQLDSRRVRDHLSKGAI